MLYVFLLPNSLLFLDFCLGPGWCCEVVKVIDRVSHLHLGTCFLWLESASGFV